MQPPAINVDVIPERTELRLSDSMRVEIHIQGPAPLRLDLPKEWLGEASAGLWKMEPLGKPALTELPGGGQKWSQSFQLDPYVPGAPVPLIFSPVKVNGQEKDLPSFSIAVTTKITNPNIEDARPITGIETLPPQPVQPATNHVPWVLAGVVGVVLVLIFVLRRRPKSEPEPNPNEWARRELAMLNAGSATFAEELAGVLRGYLHRQHGLPAETRTTAELRSANPNLEPLLELLDRCDRAKYAGEAMSVEECEEMRNEAAVAFSRDAQRSDLERSPSGRG
jgi:hypothetical protein